MELNEEHVPRGLRLPALTGFSLCEHTHGETKQPKSELEVHPFV